MLSFTKFNRGGRGFLLVSWHQTTGAALIEDNWREGVTPRRPSFFHPRSRSWGIRLPWFPPRKYPLCVSEDCDA